MSTRYWCEPASQDHVKGICSCGLAWVLRRWPWEARLFDAEFPKGAFAPRYLNASRTWTKRGRGDKAVASGSADDASSVGWPLASNDLKCSTKEAMYLVVVSDVNKRINDNIRPYVRGRYSPETWSRKTQSTPTLLQFAQAGSWVSQRLLALRHLLHAGSSASNVSRSVTSISCCIHYETCLVRFLLVETRCTWRSRAGSTL